MSGLIVLIAMTQYKFISWKQFPAILKEILPMTNEPLTNQCILLGTTSAGNAEGRPLKARGGTFKINFTEKLKK